jgi:ribosomal protein S18 acetylase RimI-like enzyme
MTGREHSDHVLRMMRELYDTDAPYLHVDPANFTRTIDRVLSEPSRGRIVLGVLDGAVAGYMLLVPYWSNEFGGIVLLLDELLVEREFRGRGVGRAFLRFLDEERPFDAVALALEVSPENAGARALYESMGFEERKLRMLTRRLTAKEIA